MAFRRDLFAQWLRATLIRMIRTGAQAAIGAIGAAAVFAEVQWDVVGGVTVLAMIVTFLTCLAGLPEAPAPISFFDSDEP